MDELFFLSYANTSLKNNPQNFYKLFEQLDFESPSFDAKEDIYIDTTEFDKIFQYIIELSNIEDPELFFSKIEQYGSINPSTNSFDKDLYHAVIAITGQRGLFNTSFGDHVSQIKKIVKRQGLKTILDSNNDEPRCGLRKIVTSYTGEDICEQSFFQKCYECYQIKFRHCLMQIVNGKEYLKISTFRDVMLWSEEINTKTHIIIEEIIEDKPFQQKLSDLKLLCPILCEFEQSQLGNSYHILNDFIFSLASFSLTRFLTKNDRRKLKHCPYCNNFFIARDMKRKRCCYSEDCLKNCERDKKRKQRSDDPVKYV